MNYDLTQDTMDTIKHILSVQNKIMLINKNLVKQASSHDLSKLGDNEKPIFDEYTPKLKETTYGSNEYKQHLREMNVALKHHYENNRHHPEHFDNEINDMNLVDIIEMFCDWLVATERHDDGDIYKSIEYNQKRFGYSDNLKHIFENTAKLFE